MHFNSPPELASRSAGLRSRRRGRGVIIFFDLPGDGGKSKLSSLWLIWVDYEAYIVRCQLKTVLFVFLNYIDV
jgi:hypothetical protein